jgi:hypothetical protein
MQLGQEAFKDTDSPVAARSEPACYERVTLKRRLHGQIRQNHTRITHVQLNYVVIMLIELLSFRTRDRLFT